MPVEAAVVDLDNQKVLQAQLLCAAAEEPLDPTVDGPMWGAERFAERWRRSRRRQADRASSRALRADLGGAVAVAQGATSLDQTDHEHPRPPPAAEQAFSVLASSSAAGSAAAPAAAAASEGISWEEIDQVERWRVHYELYEGAVYLNQGRKFIVKSLDYTNGVAYLEPSTVRYTRSVDVQRSWCCNASTRRPCRSPTLPTPKPAERARRRPRRRRRRRARGRTSAACACVSPSTATSKSGRRRARSSKAPSAAAVRTTRAASGSTCRKWRQPSWSRAEWTRMRAARGGARRVRVVAAAPAVRGGRRRLRVRRVAEARAAVEAAAALRQRRRRPRDLAARARAAGAAAERRSAADRGLRLRRRLLVLRALVQVSRVNAGTDKAAAVAVLRRLLEPVEEAAAAGPRRRRGRGARSARAARRAWRWWWAACRCWGGRSSGSAFALENRGAF